ncbi:hypothetical protein D3C78_726240 [compost metagenome]
MMLIIVMYTVVGCTDGINILVITCHLLAPSTSAASKSSLETPIIEAMYKMIACPTFPAKVTKMITGKTVLALPRRFTLPSPNSRAKCEIKPLAGLSKKLHTILITTMDTITGI